MAYIAVVEDDASVRELIICTLKSAGFEVDAFERGEDLLARYEEMNVPDAVLLDIMLPGIDGFEVFRRLSSQGDFDVPVIFLTARTTAVDKVSGLNLGADDYITKPFGVLVLSLIHILKSSILYKKAAGDTARIPGGRVR